ncbi:MAG: metallophosphoesterase family protein [Bacteroidales bacterium]|jgi:hypothetical protein|nr:metallophosphoesterase family protein [Bacteroidales bacterium]
MNFRIAVRQIVFSSILLISTSFTLAAQTQGIFSIVTCPAENTSISMNISWGADTTITECTIEYTLARDTHWKQSRTMEGTSHLCTVFDNVYSKNADGADFYEDAVFLKYEAALKELKPRREYKYRIVSERCTSDTYRFRTSGRSRWSACIISDYHVYPPLRDRLDNAMAMMDRVYEYDPGFDWVLHLGDITAWGGSYSFWQEMYKEKYFKNYMWAGVNGNHDNMSRGYIKNTNEYFKEANFYPRNGYKGEEGVCYWFYWGDALFIMLNNESMKDEEGINAAQEWVKEVVKNNPARYRVVCEHYQWFFGDSGKTSQYGRWSDLFDELGIDLALAGNNHIYVRTNALYQGKESNGSKGTVYIQTPSSDNERGVPTPNPITENLDKIRFRWSEGAMTVGAIHLDANKKRMMLTLLDRYGNILDRAEVKSKKH